MNIVKNQYRLAITRIEDAITTAVYKDKEEKLGLTREGDTWTEALTGMVREGMISQQTKDFALMIRDAGKSEAKLSVTFPSLEALKNIANPVLKDLGVDELTYTP